MMLVALRSLSIASSRNFSSSLLGKRILMAIRWSLVGRPGFFLGVLFSSFDIWVLKLVGLDHGIVHLSAMVQATGILALVKTKKCLFSKYCSPSKVGILGADKACFMLNFMRFAHTKGIP